MGNQRRINAEKAGPKVLSGDVQTTINKSAGSLSPGRYTFISTVGGYFLQMDEALHAVVTAANVTALGIPIEPDTEFPVQVDATPEGDIDGYCAWVKGTAEEDGTITANHRSRVATLADL